MLPFKISSADALYYVRQSNQVNGFKKNLPLEQKYSDFLMNEFQVILGYLGWFCPIFVLLALRTPPGPSPGLATGPSESQKFKHHRGWPPIQVTSPLCKLFSRDDDRRRPLGRAKRNAINFWHKIRPICRGRFVSPRRMWVTVVSNTVIRQLNQTDPHWLGREIFAI